MALKYACTSSVVHYVSFTLTPNLSLRAMGLQKLIKVHFAEHTENLTVVFSMHKCK